MRLALVLGTPVVAALSEWISPWKVVVAAIVVPIVAALWAGARPEVVRFGRDVAATVITAARRLLRVQSR
jgi:hypothetical protein